MQGQYQTGNDAENIIGIAKMPTSVNHVAFVWLCAVWNFNLIAVDWIEFTTQLEVASHCRFLKNSIPKINSSDPAN